MTKLNPNLTRIWTESQEETRDSLITMLLNLPFPDFDLIDSLKLPPTSNCREEENALNSLNQDCPPYLFWSICDGLCLQDTRDYETPCVGSYFQWAC